MSKDLFRSLAKAVGGRVKSLLVQAAKDEAARAVRHFRARMQDPQRHPQRPGEPAPAGSSAPALAPAAPLLEAPASLPRATRSPERAAAKQARTGDAVRSAREHAGLERDDPRAGAALDLNTASRDALIALPGIGDARADAIIRGRPFAAPGDLVARKILPASVFANLKDRIGVA